MQVNRSIIVGVVIIMVASVYQLLVVKSVHTTLTRITIGAFMLALLASLFDLFGGQAGRVSGYLVMLAAGTSILAVAASVAGNAVTKPTAPATGGGGSAGGF